MRSTVYAALFLIVALQAVAGVYILLASEFLALVQILIYGGAVTVLLLFALMLTRTGDLPETMVGAQWPVAAFASSVLVGLLIAAVATTNWPGDAAGEIVAVPFETVGEALFRQWAVPFEIASLVLLVALVGAIVLARQEEGE
jgi:NADH:ubiquinone oxidoreductase subunit 6 (subunit J)